ncbi:thymus-specific serine protease-like [Armigeres subalbatus]|uniref:thymus-specific serine protease-like n=1 Tax=Armigeres subalbatus TaxID=124917 RepID=UPI002ED566B6
MIGKAALLLGIAVALASAAIDINPSRPLLFGTHRIIPQLGNNAESNHTAIWNTVNLRQGYTNPQNTGSFPMRYVMNNQYYRRGGPIFLFIGGPWTLEAHYVEQGHFVDIAAALNGFLVANELRYYGESKPLENISRNNLRYLHNVHILSELAMFIAHIKEEVVQDPSAKVILAGVGYSASLAQWMRQRFPHLVDGVWSSSGIVQTSSDFRAFTEEVGQIIRRFGGNDCYNTIWSGFRTVENLIDIGISNQLDQLFNTCEPINATNSLDVQAFFYGIFYEISLEVVNKDLQENIRRLCEPLTDPDQENSLLALAGWLKNRFPSAVCLSMDFQTIVDTYAPINWESEIVESGERQWLFQRCTELGWPITTTSQYQPFGQRFSTELFHGICERLFDSWLTRDKFEELTAQTNDFYGGSRPEIRNSIFTHGGLDPWRFAGVRAIRSPNTYVNVIPNAVHGQDLASISAEDSDELRRSKEMVTNTIRRWVNSN